MEGLAPPPSPPPLLSDEQIFALAKNGWLSVSLPQHLQDGLSALSNASIEFFKSDTQLKADLYPKGLGTEKGFHPIENEKEYLTLRCRIHSESELELLAGHVWQDSAAFLHRILCDLGRGLDLDHEVWNPLLDGCLSIPPETDLMTPSLLRLFKYYPGSGFAAEHTDLGLLTLCVGNERGLQGLDRNLEQPDWVDANGPLVLVGDTLRRLSGNRVRAGVHRVVSNPDGRTSIVFALRPSLRHTIDLGQFGIGDNIEAKVFYKEIESRKFNINATPDIRNRQKEDIQRRRNLPDKS